MKKLLVLFLALTFSSSFAADVYDIISDFGQGTVWNWELQLVKVAHDVTLEEAIAIADADPRITYFTYTKEDGYLIVWTDPQTIGRSYTKWKAFRVKDAAFYAGEPTSLKYSNSTDTYVKQKN